jgi:hypothetical protein
MSPNKVVQFDALAAVLSIPRCPDETDWKTVDRDDYGKDEYTQSVDTDHCIDRLSQFLAWKNSEVQKQEG